MIFKVFFVLLFLWLSGFVFFLNNLPTRIESPMKKTDAVVVLTGGNGRIEEGIAIVKSSLSEKLFISGVNQSVNKNDLIKKVPLGVDFGVKANINLENVHIGYEATNTKGNASETARWLQENNIETVRLVTSHYHVPRALLHFEEVLPANINIVPHPTFDKKTPLVRRLSILFLEYNKFLRDSILRQLR